MRRSSIPLAGHVVAITGAARGIGRATARACLDAGMKVAIGDLDIETAQRTAAELGGDTLAVELNVAERPSFAHFLDETEAQLGPIDVLINNAGIMQLGPFIDEVDATARRQVDINVHGVLYGMKEALPRMTARNRGQIVNIASVAGRLGFAGGATYSGTKHFVIGVSEAARSELRGTDVEITCIMPVVVRTELGAGLKPGRFIKHIEPEDVATAIVAALRAPRFEVYVPRAVTPLIKLGSAMPHPVLEVFCRLLGVDRSLLGSDAALRAAYELRATQSDRALDRRAKP
jgi:NADP-dependent 3-hydroxy acid dehydrogenase YdfG